ncbi:hypothetical protein AY601_4061 [Pedobacter cryoconitis]|uniref:Tail tape measure protein n=1 Tax=Pedobacter cryoconitis TaxID=188932 RepID=A0A127VI21_9SPHI|nr:hypothetical protein [Pedobacter cryoconitis]AMQ00912.1 hypothetical protein AY601_4061 [Pedobacter cryoconitis]
MPELNFKISGDDSDLKKTLANAGKAAAQTGAQASKEISKGVDGEAKSRQKAVKVTEDQSKSSKSVIDAVNEETKAHDRATEAIKRKKSAFDSVTGLQIKPVQMITSPQDQQINAESRPITGLPVGAAAEFNKAASEATAFGAAATQATNAAADGTNKTTEAIKNAIIAQKDLEADIQNSKQIRGGSTDPAVIAEYTKRIQDAQAEIVKLGNIGKRGYDELGNRIKSTIGQQEILTTRLKYFQDQLNYAKAPESFVTLNRKIEEITIALEKLSNAGKKGFDELGNKIKQAEAPANSFLNTLKSIGAAILAAFSAQVIISWAKEARELAARGEGIREAFAKLDNGKTLQILRTATRGATSDIDLMAAALRAKNFQIAPELLAKGLELAGKVSRQTGQDVTYLTDSFVNGLGRKSLLILDNLQISQIQLRAEIKKTGDFQTAVANVVNEKLKSMGDVTMTSADKMAQFATRIANIKEMVGQKINLVMNYDSLREANKEFYDTGLSVKNLQRNIEPLLDKYDQLTEKAAKNGGVAKLSKIEQTLLKDAIGQVSDEIPGAITQFDKYGNAMAISTDRARDFIAQQILVLQALNEDRIKKTTERIGDLTKSISPLKSQMDELAKTGKIMIPVASIGGGGLGGSFAGGQNEIRRATEKEKKDIITKYQDISRTIAQQEALLAADSGELLKKRQKENDNFKIINKVSDGKAEAAERKAAEKLQREKDRQERADAAALSAQESLQQRMQVLKDKFARNGLTKEQEARSAIVDEFKKLAFDIEQQGRKYDAYAKKYGAARATAVLGPKQNTSSIEPIRTAAIKDLTFRQNTAAAELELIKEKALFEQFENYKKQFGEDAAKKRYAEELDIVNNYLKKVQETYAGIVLKFSVAQATGQTLTGGEKEKYDAAVKFLNDIQVKQDQQYVEAKSAAMSHEQNILVIREKYATIAKSLGTGITDAQKIELSNRRDEEIKSATTTAFQKTEIYKRLAEETITYTRSSLKAEIKAASNILKGADIPADVATNVQKHIDELNAKLDLGISASNKNTLNDRKQLLLDSLSNPLIEGTEEAKKYKKELLVIQELIDKGSSGRSGETKGLFSGDTSDVAGDISSAAGQMAAAFGDLASSLEGLNDDLAYTIGSIGELLNVASNASGSVASFATGDIIGGVTKAISAAAGLFSMGKKVREMNAAARKEVEDFYAAAIKGESDYQALLRRRELDSVARGKNSYRAIVDQLEAIKKQSPQIQAAYDKIFNALQGGSSKEGMGYEHGTWLRKAKTWDIMASLTGSDYDALARKDAEGKLVGSEKTNFDNLKSLREELEAAGISADELKKQLGELLTGTSTSGLADGLKSLFENGKRSAKDFGDSFEEIMRNALLNTFKAKYLDDALQPFYEELASMMEAGTPSEAQIAALKEKYIKLGLDADAYLNNIEKITGVDAKPGVKNGISGAIVGEAITEGTANKMLGISQAQYDVQKGTSLTAKDILAINTAQLNSLIRIEAYTGRTADNTDGLSAKLDQIIINTKVVNGDSIDQLMRNGGVKV